MKARATAAMVLALTGLALPGCGQPGTTWGGRTAAVTVRAPNWSGCPKPPTPAGNSAPPRNLECGVLRVPLDYAHPGGPQIDLALIRVRATDPAHRIGSLVFNFGGPGGSGIAQFASGGAEDYKTLGTRYDLVTFDPRGVGLSSPITCLDDKAMDAALQRDSVPGTAAERAAYLQDQQAYVHACQTHSGKLLAHVGTLDAARDLDVLRRALGDRTLHYFGISYGTWLGGSYAHQFPAGVGRAVLDGAVNTRLDPEQLSLQQTLAFQRALAAFAAWSVRQPGAPEETAEAMIAQVKVLLDGLHHEALHTRTSRKLSRALGIAGVTEALYSPRLWPVLALGLDQARGGDGSVLLGLADQQTGRNEDGTFDNSLAANTAIRCADTTRRYTVQDVEAALPRFIAASPVFGATQAWGMLQCAGWPVRGNDAAQQVSAPGAPPIVVVGNTGDPATPYAWTSVLARELGSGVVLTLKAEGHGAYDTGDACIRKAIDGYLLAGTVPAPGTACPT